jgi:hypothetical protein
MLPDYPPAMLSFGRYLGFGVIALLLAWTDLPRLQQLRGRTGEWLSNWRWSATSSTTSSSRRRSSWPDAPLPTMLIGTLPIVIAIVANFGSEALPWRRLLPSLAVIASGIALVNSMRWRCSAAAQRTRPLPGALLALAAVACLDLVPGTQFPLAAPATGTRFRHLGDRPGPGDAAAGG